MRFLFRKYKLEVLARGTLPNRLAFFQETWQSLVECAGLENRKRLITFHGFKSHSFRQFLSEFSCMQADHIADAV